MTEFATVWTDLKHLVPNSDKSILQFSQFACPYLLIGLERVPDVDCKLMEDNS
jgi:hypothetical protein